MTLSAGGFLLMSAAARAGNVTEVEANNTLGTAQVIGAGSFTLDASANIGDAFNHNTSQLLPHVTISGSGNETFDYFRFTTSQPGAIVQLDMDNAGLNTFDTEVALWDAAGSWIGEDDDFFFGDSEPGSTSGLDSFGAFRAGAAGTYYVGVARFSASGTTGGWNTSSSLPPSGTNYLLHISTGNDVAWNTAANGAWSSAGHWTGGFSPDASLNARFQAGGTYNVSVGTASTAKSVNVSAGNVTLGLANPGASLAVTGEFNVDGAAGTSATVVGGTASVGIAYIGRTANGALNVGTGGTFESADHVYVGRNGTGGVAQSAGSVHVKNGNHLFLGFDTTGQGTYTLSGGTLTVSGSEFIGESGQGTFTQTAGTHSVAGSIRLGDANGSTGSMEISGGTLSAAGMYIGGDPTGPHGVGSFTISGTASVAVSGMTRVWDFSDRINLAGGTLRTYSYLSSAYVGSNVSGELSVGTLWTSGTFWLDGGTALANFIEIPADGIFKGSGTLTSNFGLANGGILSPGDGGAGSLFIDSIVNGFRNVSFNGARSGRLDVDLGGIAAGTFDTLNVLGTVALGGNLNLSLLDGFTPTLGQSWTILTNDGTDAIAGRFINATNTGLGYDLLTAGGFSYRIDYTGGTGNDVVVTAVPEPAAIGLLATTALLLARRRRL